MSLINILKGLHKKINILDSKMNKLDIKMNSIKKMLTSVDCGESQLKFVTSYNDYYSIYETVKKNVNDPCAVTRDPKPTNVYINGVLITEKENYPPVYYFETNGNAYLSVYIPKDSNCRFDITNTYGNTTTYFNLLL